MEPAPSEPRLERGKPVSAQYPKTKYRQALPSLLMETGDRCGYSLQHILDLNAAHLVTKRLDRTQLKNTFLAAAMASGTDSTNDLFRAGMD